MHVSDKANKNNTFMLFIIFCVCASIYTSISLHSKFTNMKVKILY